MSAIDDLLAGWTLPYDATPVRIDERVERALSRVLPQQWRPSSLVRYATVTTTRPRGVSSRRQADAWLVIGHHTLPLVRRADELVATMVLSPRADRHPLRRAFNRHERPSLGHMPAAGDVRQG